MNRGDIILVSVSGDYGKPRPAVIVQSDVFNSTHASIVVCLITSHILEVETFRLKVSPSKGNGLKIESQIMSDKIVTLKRGKITSKVGVLEKKYLIKLNRQLFLFLGLSD